MTGIKRLSPRQSRKVNTLVKKECCNCENGNCILLDDGDTCVCPQLIWQKNDDIALLWRAYHTFFLMLAFL